MSQAPHQKIIDGKRIYVIGQDQKTNNSLTKLSFNYFRPWRPLLSTASPGISPKLAHAKICRLFHSLAELFCFNLIGVANLAYDRKSVKVPMTDSSAPRSADGPPPEQPSRPKKVKRPSVPPSRSRKKKNFKGTKRTDCPGVTVVSQPVSTGSILLSIAPTSDCGTGPRQRMQFNQSLVPCGHFLPALRDSGFLVISTPLLPSDLQKRSLSATSRFLKSSNSKAVTHHPSDPGHRLVCGNDNSNESSDDGPTAMIKDLKE